MAYTFVFILLLGVVSAFSFLLPQTPVTKPLSHQLQNSLCPCPRNYLPVCATINNERRITFNNFCEFDCFKDFYRKRGGDVFMLWSGVRCYEMNKIFKLESLDENLLLDNHRAYYF